MRNNYSKNCYIEFQKLITQPNLNQKFVTENYVEVKRVFKRVYVINLLKNRPELQNIFDDSFDMTFSLILESSYALYTGQCRASLLLIRSALETALQFNITKEREWIVQNFEKEKVFQKIDYRFVETKKKLIGDIKEYVSEQEYSEYYLTIERSLSYYKKLSEVVHSSGSRVPLEISYFYQNLKEDTIIDKKKFFDLFSNSLETLFTLLYFLSRERFKNWDSYELRNILSVIFRGNKLERYIKFVKI